MVTKTFTGKFLSKLDKIDRKEIESFLVEIVKEKSFLEIIFDSLREGVIVTDESLNVLFLNRSARNDLGISARKKVGGVCVLELIRDDSLRSIVERFRSDLAPVTNLEIAVEQPVERIFDVNIMAIRDAKKKVLSIIFFLSDLTDRRKAEQSRAQSEKLSSLATLTAGIAHEIKNPLNSLNIHIQLIKRSIDEARSSSTSINLDRFLKSIDVIEEEINRLGNVVDDFLGAVRPSEPQFDLNNINKVIDDVVRMIKPEANENHVEIVAELEPDSPPLYIDANQIKQALINVVRNAIAATEESRDGLIRIHTRCDGLAMYIDIIDNGCGIDEDDYVKIFEPYYTTKHSGTGLGLMIVYRIMKEHDGAIDLRSEVGEGTTFSLILPLPQASPRLLEAVGIQPDDHGRD